MDEPIKIIEPPIDYRLQQIKLPLYSVKTFDKWMKSFKKFSIITRKQYYSYITKLLNNKLQITIKEIIDFLSKNTTVPKICAVRLYIKYLYYEKDISIRDFQYPEVNKEPGLKQAAINREQLEIISKEFKKYHKTFLAMDDYSFFTEILFSLGLRISEGVKMQTMQIRWQKWVENKEDWGEIEIIKSKGDRSRIVPVDPKLMQKLYDNATKNEFGKLDRDKEFYFDFGYEAYLNSKRFRRRGKEKISLNGKRVKYVNKVVNTYRKLLNKITFDKFGYKLKTHTLRASRATELDEKGIRMSIIKEYLGHENISTTSKYIRGTPEKTKQALKDKDI